VVIAQALVTEFAVEALVVTALPGFAELDERGVDLLLRQPLEDGVAEEFGAVVRSQESRCAVLRDQVGKHLDHPAGSNRASDIDRQARTGELVDHRQALDLLAARAGIEHEVIGPDVIRTECGQGPGP